MLRSRPFIADENLPYVQREQRWVILDGSQKLQPMDVFFAAAQAAIDRRDAAADARARGEGAFVCHVVSLTAASA